MLPGFRFLLAAIILSMSILIFGLGAAALLRTAHEEFASAPAWQPAPETRFARAGDATNEATKPVLALLRVDDAPKAEPSAPADATAASSAEPAAIPAPGPESAPIAAPSPQDSASAETAKPETPIAESPVSENPVAASPVAENPVITSPAAESVASAPENPAPAETALAPAELPAPADETRVAATEPATVNESIPAVAAEAAPAVPEQASVSNPPSAGVGAASNTIATLGGPAVTIKAASPANPTVAKPDKNALKKKRLQTLRANARRKALARAAQQASQPPLDWFGQPMRAQ